MSQDLTTPTLWTSHSWIPERSTLRKILEEVFRVDAEFDAFILDHFVRAFKHIGTGMDRVNKMNIVLLTIEPEDIWAQLKRHYGERLQPCMSKIVEDLPEGRQKERAAKQREKLNQLYIDREVFARYRFDTRMLDFQILELRRNISCGPFPHEDDILDDRYILKYQIGKGDHGTVWLATDRRAPSQSQPIAVKILHGQYNDEPIILKKFQNCASNIMKLSAKTPHIIKVLDGPKFDEALKLHYYAMEYCSNSNLFYAVTERKIDLNNALRAVIQIGEALQVTHDAKIVHRDVKPTNILLDTHWLAKLSDFDMARNLAAGLPTAAGRIIGTFGYAAPEQMEARSVIDYRADIYSLAMTAIFVLAGRKLSPQSQSNAGQLIDEVKGISDSLRNILKKATAYEPSHRLNKLSHLCDALKLHLDELEESDVVIQQSYEEETMHGERLSELLSAAMARQEQTTTAGSTATDEMRKLSQDTRAEFELLFIAGTLLGSRVPLQLGSTVTIGRALGSFVLIDDPMVSKRHAEMIVDPEHVSIRDLGSFNGVYVNGKRITSEFVALEPGARLAIGHSILELVKPNRSS